MRQYRILPILAGVALLSGPALAVDVGSIAGTYGDAAGRLGCAADGEHLTFTDDGRVELQEHAGAEGQLVATFEVTDGGQVLLSLIEPEGDALELQPDGNRLLIVGYSVGGSPDAAELDAWSHRHGGAFVPCEEMN